MPYEITRDRARMDLEAVWQMLRSSYWSPGIQRQVVERAIANSLCVGAFDAEGRQVGFARAVTDTATFAWLCDVIVDPAHRGRGIAKQMLESMLAHPEIASLRRWSLATRDAHTLYEQYGFAPVAPGRWMELVMDRRTWAEPDADARP